MKKDKKMFIIIEFVLAVVIILLASVMLQEKNGQDSKKVSVIIQNSNDSQWAAFKYGLKMAAEDHGVEMLVVSTEGVLTAEAEKELIENEIINGADAVIVQPVSETYTERMLKRIQNKIPVMLVDDVAKKEKDESGIAVTEPDNYAMGKTLAEELLKDYNGKINGMTFGIFSGTEESEAVSSRRKGFEDVLKDTDARIVWDMADSSLRDAKEKLEAQPKVDFIIAIDDNSLITAGECSAANNLHGAIIYGIGNSTEAFYYLDAGHAECLVVPDEFNVGYQSLTEIVETMKHPFHKTQNQIVSHTVIRRDTLFLKENQKILFTMSQ